MNRFLFRVYDDDAIKPSFVHSLEIAVTVRFTTDKWPGDNAEIYRVPTLVYRPDGDFDVNDVLAKARAHLQYVYPDKKLGLGILV